MKNSAQELSQTIQRNYELVPVFIEIADSASTPPETRKAVLTQARLNASFFYHHQASRLAEVRKSGDPKRIEAFEAYLSQLSYKNQALANSHFIDKLLN
jgi:hypothetical protein